MNRNLPRGSAGHRFHQFRKPATRSAKEVFIGEVDHRLHHIDLRMTTKRRKGRADRGRAGEDPVLLWDVAAGALTPACRNDYSRNDAHPEMLCLILRLGFSACCRFCEQILFGQRRRVGLAVTGKRAT
jgi:hypothetical protein